MSENTLTDISNNIVESSTTECSICYSDGTHGGKVEPACGHFICLPCYTNLIIQKNASAPCPCCRKKFVLPEDIVVNKQDIDSYVSGTGSGTGVGYSYTYYPTGFVSSSTGSTYYVSGTTGTTGYVSGSTSYTGLPITTGYISTLIAYNSIPAGATGRAPFGF